MHLPNIQEIKDDIEIIVHAVEEKEEAVLDMFEETGGIHTHEHRLLHSGEAIFTRVMMLIGA